MLASVPQRHRHGAALQEHSSLQQSPAPGASQPCRQRHLAESSLWLQTPFLQSWTKIRVGWRVAECQLLASVPARSRKS